jgi:hypothetical protein
LLLLDCEARHNLFVVAQLVVGLLWVAQQGTSTDAPHGKVLLAGSSQQRRA